jgi:hypothetical protein
MNFGTSCLRRGLPTCWIFQEGCIEKEIATVQNLCCFKRGIFVKLLGTKSWGFLGQLTLVRSRKTKESVGFYNIKIKGVKSSKP